MFLNLCFKEMDDDSRKLNTGGKALGKEEYRRKQTWRQKWRSFSCEAPIISKKWKINHLWKVTIKL